MAQLLCVAFVCLPESEFQSVSTENFVTLTPFLKARTRLEWYAKRRCLPLSICQGAEASEAVVRYQWLHWLDPPVVCTCVKTQSSQLPLSSAHSARIVIGLCSWSVSTLKSLGGGGWRRVVSNQSKSWLFSESLSLVWRLVQKQGFKTYTKEDRCFRDMVPHPHSGVRWDQPSQQGLSLNGAWIGVWLLLFPPLLLITKWDFLDVLYAKWQSSRLPLAPIIPLLTAEGRAIFFYPPPPPQIASLPPLKK